MNNTLELNYWLSIFRQRKDKYESRGWGYNLGLLFELRSLQGKYSYNDFHHLPEHYTENFHQFLFLKSRKLKMLEFELLKLYRRNDLGSIQRKTKAIKKQHRDEAWKQQVQATRHQTDWMLEMSNEEYLQALERMSDINNVDDWMSSESRNYEQ